MSENNEYYTGGEVMKEKRSGPGIVAQLIIVAVLSAILGGVVTGAFFYFVAPEISSRYIDRIASGQDNVDNGSSSGGGSIDSSSAGNSDGSGSSGTKTVEIVDKTDSLISFLILLFSISKIILTDSVYY